MGLNSYDINGGEQFVSNATRSFSVQALQSLTSLTSNEGISSISFNIVIYQFGKEIETTEITKVIYFGDYNKAESIIVVSGVESYNNIYLSLLNGETSREVVAYASNANGDVTYKDLGYRLYQIDEDTNLTSPYTGTNLTISHNTETNTFEIKANTKGGLYQLELYAKDSDNVVYKINITVSDGLSEATAYLIKDLNDFVALAGDTSGQYYKLWQDIDISALSTTDWWSKDREFAGHLDGAMTIEDPNNEDKIVYRYYSLMNLTISQDMALTDATCFGLFNTVTGTIKNVVFTNVEINITLDNTNTGDKPVNIGVITGINNGVIENCSVNISSSAIKFTNTASNITYNIGLIAGKNNSTVSYQNTNIGSNYSHLVDVDTTGSSVGKLTIDIEKGNTYFNTSTNIYVGGVVGQNASGANINADYKDKGAKNIREKINVVVNIEVNVDYDASNAPMNINSLSVGGVVGFNQDDVLVLGKMTYKEALDMGIRDAVSFGP
ncbi:MAG: hypothetical protein J6Q15_00580, partial [Clostridia bacterium]|nr:hypothetical protein [Clostridia bacterium]